MSRWDTLKARLQHVFAGGRRRPGSTPHRHPIWPWALGIPLGLIAILLIVLATIDWNAMRGPVSNYLSARLDRPVRIAGDLDVHLFSWTPTATANDIIVAQPSWASDAKEDFADIQQLGIALDLKALIGGHIVLPEVIVERPQLRLIREQDGKANWDFGTPGAKSSQPSHLPPIRHFAIRGGTIDANDAVRHLVFKGTISSEETDTKSNGQFFHLAGKGTLNRAPFIADVRGDPLLNVDPEKPYTFHGNIKAGQTRIAADGSIDKPFDLGALQAALKLAGGDLADLYYLTGLTLPNTQAYRLTGKLRRNGNNFRIDDLAGKLGSSDIAGTLMVDASGAKPYVRGDLRSHRLAFSDIGPLIGIRPGAAPAASAAKSAATVRVLPDAPLHVERLRQMDADVRYRADRVVSRDFPLRDASATVGLKDGVLKLTPLSFDFSKGKLDGNISIDARKDVPVSDIDVRLLGLKLEQFISSSKGPPSIEGDAVARAKLHATGGTMRAAAAHADGNFAVAIPHGAMRQAFAELLGIDVSRALGLLLTGSKAQTELRCGIADFKAQNGVMTLQNFVFDTGVVQATAQGTVDLRTEQLNVAITGHPKKPEIIRIRTPITITGPLAKPSIGVKAGKAIAQGGLAALAAVVNPLAVVLPFLDPGLAKDANCGALIQEAQAKGAPAKTVTR